MSRGAKHYKQYSTHRLNRGSVGHGRYRSDVLDRLIDCGGVIRPVFAANNEEFDIFIYTILEQMYHSRANICRAYNRLFWPKTETGKGSAGAFRQAEEERAFDWADPTDRILALNLLYDLNLTRGTATRPKIPLFADCTDDRRAG